MVKSKSKSRRVLKSNRRSSITKRKSNQKRIMHLLKHAPSLPHAIIKNLRHLARSLGGRLSQHEDDHTKLFLIPEKHSNQFIRDAQDIFDDYNFKYAPRKMTTAEKKSMSTQTSSYVSEGTQM